MATKTQSLLEQAEDLLDATGSILPHLHRLEEPLTHYNGSLTQATAAILDVLGGSFAELSLRSEGGVAVGLFYAQCEPLSVGYLMAYLEACQTVVRQHRNELRSRFPYDAMAVRAQTLRCLFLEASSVSTKRDQEI